MRYIDLDLDSERPKFNHLKKKLFQTKLGKLELKFFLFDCLFVCLENLAVQPNSEKPESPNSPNNKKIYLSSVKYDWLNKHVKSSDQQMGAVHPVLSGAHPYLSGAHPYLVTIVHKTFTFIFTITYYCPAV